MSWPDFPSRIDSETPLVPGDSLDGALQLGVPAIDRQHRAIFVLLDKLHALGAAPFGEAAAELFEKLGHTFMKHIADEEAYLHEIGMPTREVAAHVDDHRKFFELYVDINMTLMQGNPVPVADMADRLRSWVIQHVVEYDLDMRRYEPPGDR